MQEYYFDFRGLTTHYYKTAPRENKIILAHANGYSAYTYRYLIEFLSKDYQVFAMDLMGHGKSQGNLNIDGYTGWLYFRDQILALCEQEKIDKVTGIGHSLGGAAMILAGKSHPELFYKIIALDPVVLGYLMTGYSKLFQVPLARVALKRRRKFESLDYVKKVYRRTAAFSSWDEGVFDDYLSSCFRETGEGEEVELCLDPKVEARIFNAASVRNILFRYKANKTEIHIVRPADSTVCPKSTARRILKGNEHSTLTSEKGISHFFPFEKTEYTKNLIVDKLESDIHNKRELL